MLGVYRFPGWHPVKITLSIFLSFIIHIWLPSCSLLKRVFLHKHTVNFLHSIKWAFYKAYSGLSAQHAVGFFFFAQHAVGLFVQHTLGFLHSTQWAFCTACSGLSVQHAVTSLLMWIVSSFTDMPFGSTCPSLYQPHTWVLIYFLKHLW